MRIRAARVGGSVTAAGSVASRRGAVLSWLASTREAARLREAREAAGLTRPVLATRMGVNQAWLAFRETGKTLLTADEAERIGNAIKGDGAMTGRAEQ